MFKLFRNIGLITLVIASFIYTEKLVTVVKDYDDIMITIKNNVSNHEIKAIDAKIMNNTIITGISGKKVNIDSTYQSMREYGKYNEKLIKYKKVNPNNLLKDNLDKYIIGSQKKNKVALIYVLNKNEKINNKLNLFVTNSYYKNYKNTLYNLNKKYLLGSIDNNMEINKYIKNILNQKNIYCYLEEKNEKVLKDCFKNNYKTIIPSIIINNNSLTKLEKNLKSGIIITIKISNYQNIIRYIENKGYEIVTLDELLDENI